MAKSRPALGGEVRGERDETWRGGDSERAASVRGEVSKTATSAWL